MAALKETIKAATIARVTRKSDGKVLGFLVKSNHTEEYYQVTCTRIGGERIFSCTCYAGQHGFVNCKSGHCCHVQAVLEVCEARKQAAAQAAFASVFQAIAQFATEQKAANEQAAQAAMVEAAQAAIEFPKAKKATAKRAKQFADMPLNGHGFTMQAVPELNGRIVPM